MRILIPIDGSACADSTLRWAAETMNPHTTDYVLLHIGRPAGLRTEAENPGEILKRGQRLMENLGGRVARTDYVQGEEIADAILSYASRPEIDQVLMGSHGRSGVARLLMGSVSVEVLKHCRKPVFVYQNRDAIRETVSVTGSRLDG